MIKVDFHTHTTSSDGILTPTEVITRAFKKEVKYIAITDHDTVAGLEEASLTAKKLNINFIPGIELSTEYKGESIHILGLFKDNSYKDPNFITYLYNLKNRRVLRAKEMVRLLKEHFNIEIDFENVLKRGKEVIARPHIAQEIIACGYNYTQDYIFKNFIGKGCAAYIPTTKATPKEGVELLKKYNAITILAHPILIKNSPLEDFLSIGLDGIEAIYFQNTAEDEIFLKDFAKKNNLLISAGSDCHGNLKGDTRHGDIGAMKMEKQDLEELLKNLSI